MKAIIAFFQKIVFDYYHHSGDASYNWAGNQIAKLNPEKLLDVGCGDGTRLVKYLTKPPPFFYGVEGSPELADLARKRGMRIDVFDLNGKWPYPDNFFNAIHSAQVIEHIHNTRLFFVEAFRVLAPGGVLIMTSENLCSLLNLGAITLGYTPFPLINVCGLYLGNPLGLHAGEEYERKTAPLPIDLPAFSGLAGHIRVLSVRQVHELLSVIGFEHIEIKSIGLMPLPKWIGTMLENIFYKRGHWLLIKAIKP